MIVQRVGDHLDLGLRHFDVALEFLPAGRGVHEDEVCQTRNLAQAFVVVSLVGIA